MNWCEVWICKWKAGLCITFAACVSCVSGQAAPQVLVELFTSEGCSSCPPADALLQKLSREQLVPGVSVIALSEHVDYWNHLGWRDPFSSEQLTARQQRYAVKIGSPGPYTPQMIVDGVEAFVGSDSERARRAIALAAARPKVDVTAERAGPGALHVRVPANPAPSEVFIAVVYDPAPSAVSRGENSGRRLTHISVVKSLTRVREVAPKMGVDIDVPIIYDDKLPNQRVVIFVQERGQGRVLGSAEVSVRQSAGMVARWSPQK